MADSQLSAVKRKGQINGPQTYDQLRKRGSINSTATAKAVARLKKSGK